MTRWERLFGWALMGSGAAIALVGLALAAGGYVRGAAPALAGVVVGLVGFGQRAGDPSLSDRPLLRRAVVMLAVGWLLAFILLR